jgi:hypothetical protein
MPSPPPLTVPMLPVAIRPMPADPMRRCATLSGRCQPTRRGAALCDARQSGHCNARQYEADRRLTMPCHALLSGRRSPFHAIAPHGLALRPHRCPSSLTLAGRAFPACAMRCFPIHAVAALRTIPADPADAIHAVALHRSPIRTFTVRADPAVAIRRATCLSPPMPRPALRPLLRFASLAYATRCLPIPCRALLSGPCAATHCHAVPCPAGAPLLAHALRPLHGTPHLVAAHRSFPASACHASLALRTSANQSGLCATSPCITLLSHARRSDPCLGFAAIALLALAIRPGADH